MCIRPAAVSDAPALARVHVATWRAAYRDLLPEAVLQRLSEEDRTRRWEQILTHSPHGTLVAEGEQELLGFVSFGTSRDSDAVPQQTAELIALYVGPEHWGRGVGWRLWRAAREALEIDEYREITLWVLEGNRRGRTFYERVGFLLDAEGRQTVEIQGVSLAELRYRMPLLRTTESE